MLCRTRVYDTYSYLATKSICMETLDGMSPFLGISILNASLVRCNLMLGMTGTPYIIISQDVYPFLEYSNNFLIVFNEISTVGGEG